MTAVDGWRLGLAICGDTGAARHTAVPGVDAHVAGVGHRPDEHPEQEARATVIARACGSYVVFASAAGAVGPECPATCGASVIVSQGGRVVARAGPGPDEIVRATLA